MTHAPDTGRTAEEMREQIARFWWDRVCPTSYVGRWNEAKEHSGFFKQLVSETYEDADAILSGPLAQLASEAAHLRAENANLRDRVREAEKGGQKMMCEAAAMVCDGLADGAAHSLQESAPEDAERWEAVKFSAESLAATIRLLALSPEPQEAGDHEPR